MTAAELRNSAGREPFALMEVEVPVCPHRYGSAPCTATGTEKCYNTYATCDDRPNFALASRIYTFCDTERAANAAYNTTGISYVDGTWPSSSGETSYIGRVIPCIQGKIATASTKIQPGEGLGERVSLSIRFKDHSDGDFGLDPYRSERTFDPADRGTFFPKFQVRNPYQQGRPVWIKRGYIDDSNESLVIDSTEQYVWEKVAGPSSAGLVSITIKDILKLADAERAQAPVASRGKLSATITSGSTGVALSPIGIGDTYPSSGYLRIDDEIIQFTRSSGTLSLESRGEFQGLGFSVAAAHDSGATVQKCWHVDDQRVDAVVYQLLTSYAPIATGFVPYADWQAEADSWLNGAVLTALVTKPTGVKDHLDRLCQLAQIKVFYDTRAQEIKLQAVRPQAESSIRSLSTEDFIENSSEASVMDDMRLSESWVYHTLRDQTKEFDNVLNYQKVTVAIDEDATGPNKWTDQRRIHSVPTEQWQIPDGLATASTSRRLNRYRDPPIRIDFQLDAAKATGIWVGQQVYITFRDVVDKTGSPVKRRYEITEAQEVEPGHLFQYAALTSDFQGRYCFIVASGTGDYSSATEEEKSAGGWIIQAGSSTFSDGGGAYKIP